MSPQNASGEAASLTVDAGESVQIVHLSGRLDGPGVAAVELGFNAAAVASGKNIVVDLSQVTFVASLGIRMLVTAAKRLGASGRKLVLLSPNDLVDESLKSIDLYQLIPVAFSRQEALELADV